MTEPTKPKKYFTDETEDDIIAYALETNNYKKEMMYVRKM